MLYPWRYWMTTYEEIAVIGFVTEPAHQEHQARRDRIAYAPGPIRPLGVVQLNTEASGARFVASPWNVW